MATEDTRSERPIVVVTGLGVVTPLGSDPALLWDRVCDGTTGIRPIESFDVSRCRTQIAATCNDFDPSTYFDPREIRRLGRASQLAGAAADLCLRDAGLVRNRRDGHEIGVVIGTGIGGQDCIEEYCRSFFVGPPGGSEAFGITRSMYSAPGSNLSIRHRLTGPHLTISTACSSGANAIGVAFEMIRAGRATRVLAGGVDAPVTEVIWDAWDKLRVMSCRNDDPAAACRPFDRNRDGFVLGEGAAMLLLESRVAAQSREAPIYGEILGYASNQDAFHITAPSPEGEAHAMSQALQDARIGARDVDYVNAHATATLLSDAVETQAIKMALGARARQIPVSSNKSVLGHCMGAAGAIEAVISLLALRHRVVPPTINCTEADPSCDLDYVTEGPRRADLNCIVSNSFAFGGSNAVLVLGRDGVSSDLCRERRRAGRTARE
ncbi:MAG: beta-ketoacyl-[acyl-carrier-protein] synthase family protein [Acidobacteria bacterium]|nr:beta-ketoacyl-[acyl-carrier-protein] synthase family protein [Acidobacteriota bacterium]